MKYIIERTCQAYFAQAVDKTHQYAKTVDYPYPAREESLSLMNLLNAKATLEKKFDSPINWTVENKEFTCNHAGGITLKLHMVN